MNDWISLLTFASALGCGLIAGVFFAFSSFVMRALAAAALLIVALRKSTC
jgi:uncharacterized membrane protein